MDIDTIKNTQKLFKQKSLLDVALEVEKFLDFMNIYVYPNWFEGELVVGPLVGRYWITVVLCYDFNKMPDPAGARVLHDVGVKCDYKKDVMMVPIKIETPNDFRPNSKKPKLEPKKVWHVELKIPRRFIDEIDFSDLEELDDEVDVNAVSDATDQDMNTPLSDTDVQQDQAAADIEPGFDTGEDNV